MWKIVAFLLLYNSFCITEKLKVHQILASFCYKNQFNDIVLIDFDNDIEVFKGQYDLQIKMYNQPNMSTQTSFIIAKVKEGRSIFDILTILQKHPVQMSLIIVPNTLAKEKLAKVLSVFKHDLSFYTLEEQKDKTYQWYHTIFLENKKTILKQKLEFDINGRIIQFQDLQGIELKTTTLPITPWIDFQNCSTLGCQYHGILVDLVNSWTKLLNFTLVVHKDPTDDWGIYPINGKISLTDKKATSQSSITHIEVHTIIYLADAAGEYKGVMGKVIDGTYDFSLARWFYTLERQKILDFVPIGKDKSVLALHQDSLTFRWKMLIKPFQNNVWFIILCSVTIVFILYGILMKCAKKVTSLKVLKITISISFVMMHAYYTGAMAMFFTSKPSVGFTTLRDVLKAVPEWTLVYLQGMEVQFQEPVLKVRKSSNEGNTFIIYFKIFLYFREKLILSTIGKLPKMI